MAMTYCINPQQPPAPPSEHLRFSALQWSGLVDTIEFYVSELAQNRSPVLHHEAVLHYLHAGYDMWFMLPGEYRFDQSLLRGYFKLADLLLGEPEILDQLTGRVNNYDLDKSIIDEIGTTQAIEAYTADQFRSDLQRLREFAAKYRSFIFS
jgi:hypothetical protein